MSQSSKFILLFVFFIIRTYSVYADPLARFFPSRSPVPRYDFSSYLRPQRVTYPEPDVQTFNNGVDLNNNGLSAMRSGDLAQAGRLFRQACELVPGEKGFWNNWLIAARRLNDEKMVMQIANHIMALDPSDSQAPYAAGLLWLNDMKQPEKAIPYLNHALSVSNSDPAIATALATALDQAGYKDDAFELLKKYAPKAPEDPYPSYLLGLQYLEREDFNSAIRALNSARLKDDKGYAHDAWIRARYFAGQLEGLEHDCRNALKRFPEMLNRESLERILISLQPGDFRMIERIGVKLSMPSSIEKLDFLIRPIPDIQNHQHVDLVSAEFVSRNKRIKADLSQKEAGRLRVQVPRGALAPEFQFVLTSRIRTQAMLGSRLGKNTQPLPDLKPLKKDPMLSLSDPILQQLAARISQQPGNFVQNASVAVSRGLTYKENYEDMPVEWALRNPDSCDCTEYARLLTALCLLQGVPARVATGFLIKTELIGQDTSIGHAWCEVFFKGRGWIPIDPTLQANMRWAYFGNLLSDQILFDYMNTDKRTRISVDFVSSRPDLQVNLSNVYRISHW